MSVAVMPSSSLLSHEKLFDTIKLQTQSLTIIVRKVFQDPDGG